MLSMLWVPPLSAQVRDLTLQDAILLALDANPDLAVSRVDVNRAMSQVDVQAGVFDPKFDFTVDRINRESPTATELDGAKVQISDTRRANVGVSSQLKDGTKLSTTLNNRRSETNSRFTSLNPNFTSNLVLSFTRPLIKGGGRTPNLSQWRQAVNARYRAEKDWLRVAQDTVQAVARAYWDMVFAQRDVLVKNQAVAGAQKLLDYNRRRQEIGVGSEVETLEAESVLAARREELVSSRRLVGLSHQELMALLSYEAIGFGVTLDPVDSPDPGEDRPVLEESLRAAFEGRVEVEAALIDIRSRQIQVTYLKNQKRPQVDLTGGYTLNGLGRTLADAHEQVLEAGFPEWTLGFTVAVPLNNRANRGQLETGRHDLDRARKTLQLLQNRIRKEVNTAFLSVESDLERVSAARLAESLAERKLDAEETRYEQGLISNFDLLRFQEDLSSARSRAVRAVTDLLKSRTDLDRATGHILEVRGITMDVRTLTRTLEGLVMPPATPSM